MLLDLLLIQRPGIWPQVVTWKQAHYRRILTGSGYKKVEIYCGDETTQVGPGAIMYCAGNVLHGIKNTGKVPMTFYWSKWSARGF